MGIAVNFPFTIEIDLASQKLEKFDKHQVRRLSAMPGQYLHQADYEAMLAHDDAVLYEVYEINRPQIAGELLTGLTVLHPGKVGNEYFMTKGHFHAVRETAEVYHCLRGRGLLVMETPEGDWAIKEMKPGRIVYVPPRWAHRTVNVSSDQALVFFFVYPGHAGHDYGSIESQGFRKLVVEENGQPKIIDNPRWQSPEKRQ